MKNLNEPVNEEISAPEKKKFLAKGLIFETQRMGENMKVWQNGTYICTLMSTVFNLHKLPTVEFLSRLWKSYTDISFYWEGDPDINWNALLEIRAFISPSMREKLNLPPKYWTIATRISKNSNLDRNGGDYSFWTNYYPVEEGYEVHYFTSSEFAFCSICGHFTSTCNCKEHIIVKKLPDIIRPVF